MSHIVRVFLAMVMASSQAFAQNRTYLSNSASDDVYKNKLSVFYYNKTGAEVLRPVKLLGQVARPGIYNVPENTELTTLLSIAGGMEKGADLKNVSIGNPNGTQTKMNLADQLISGHDYSLKTNDIIYIPERKNTFDQDTTNTVLVVSTIASLLLTGIVVFRPR
jgi:hypothetical protein